MNQQTCNPAWLDAFLKNELNESEEQMLTSHLDECSDCREELESRAAEQSVWREASNMLGGSILLSTAKISDIRSGTVRSPQIELVLQQLAPTDDPESLGRIGGYEVTGVVGAGGMGVVLKAHDRSLDRIVAIKVMSPHLASSGSARRRFAREAKAAAAVLHPNVIAIHSVASEDANPFLVMPYVRGASLQKRIDSQGPLPLKDTLRIGAQIAAGLAAAHEQGLVHRDIKPANILLEEGVERVTITDFGLARAVDDASMTCSGVIAGTPQYMSPEQTRGEPIDARSDLFSLGSVLYAMCAGRSPFRAETTYGVLHRIANDNPTPVCEVNSDVPEWLGHIIERLMTKRPEDRFESAAQVAELLEGCLAHVQQPAAIPLPETVAALAPKKTRRPPMGKFIAAAAGAVALFFAGILIVLELRKGTLTIESELDDVPIRILQGDEVVKELTVSKEGATTRIGAGKYIVEIGEEFDKAVIKDGGVELSRGATVIVKVTQSNADTAADENAKDEAGKALLRATTDGSNPVLISDQFIRQTRENLAQISLAFHNYHEEHGHLPGFASVDGNGSPLLSWRVHLLPYMGDETKALHSEFRLNEAWDSPHNRKLIARMPSVYSVPLAAPLPIGHTCYVVPRSVLTLFPDHARGIDFSDIYQGLPNIVLVVEGDRDVATAWTKPTDLPFDRKTPLAHLGNLRDGGFLVSWASGKVSFIPNSVAAHHQDRTEFLRGLFEQVGGRGVEYYLDLPLTVGPHNNDGVSSADLTQEQPQPANPHADAESNRAGTLAPSQEQVIAKGIAFLKAKQHDDGSWEGTPVDGVTGLAAAALLQAGVKAYDPTIMKALTYLRKVDPEMTYTVAVQTIVFCAASPQEDAELIRRNVAWLEKAQIAEGDSQGSWSYGTNRGSGGDGSCTRFALLGLDAARKAGFDVQETTWKLVSDYLLTHQNKNGGWSYVPGDKTTLTMTLAGVSGLATANRHLPRNEQSTSREAAIRKAEKLIEMSMREFPGEQFMFYALHCLERAGHLSDITRFGELDWKEFVSRQLLSTQKTNSSYGLWRSPNATECDVIATSFALLTLCGQPEPKPIAQDRGSFVTIPLRAEWVSEEWLKRNIGLRHLTILSGKVEQDDAVTNAPNRPVRGILYDCRLESYEQVTRDGVKYWDVRLFVPRKPVCLLGSSWFKHSDPTDPVDPRHTTDPLLDLTQDDPQSRLDAAMKDGYSFCLDIETLITDSLKLRTDGRFGFMDVIKPTSVKDAVSHFNEMAKSHVHGRQQPELTVEEMTAAFRLWIANDECTEATRKDFQQVLDTQMLRPGHILQFDTESETDGHLFEVWSIQFGDDKSYAWFKIRDSKLLSRLKKDEERKAWEQRIDQMKKSFHEYKRRGDTPKAYDTNPADSEPKDATKDSAVTVPPMEFNTLEDFLKPGRELFDKEMKRIDERLATVVERSAEHSLLTTKKKQLQQQWDLSVAQVKGMAAAAKAGKPVQLAPIVIPNNSRPWQAPMPDPLLGHDEDIAKVLAGTWQVKRYVAGGEEAPLDGATVTFSNNMWIMHLKLGDEEGDIKQVYRIGNDKIDIWDTDSGPDIRTALPYLGSYSLENDTLRICYHDRAMELETPQSRPPVQPGKGFIFLELQRAPRAEKVSVAKGETDDLRSGQSYKIKLLVLASDDLKPVAGATVDVTLTRSDSGVTGDGGFAGFKTDEEGIATIDKSLWPGRYQIQVRAPKDSRFRDTEFSKDESILVVHEDGRYSPREFRLAVKDDKQAAADSVKPAPNADQKYKYPPSEFPPFVSYVVRGPEDFMDRVEASKGLSSAHKRLSPNAELVFDALVKKSQEMKRMVTVHEFAEALKNPPKPLTLDDYNFLYFLVGQAQQPRFDRYELSSQLTKKTDDISRFSVDYKTESLLDDQVVETGEYQVAIDGKKLYEKTKTQSNNGKPKEEIFSFDGDVVRLSNQLRESDVPQANGHYANVAIQNSNDWFFRDGNPVRIMRLFDLKKRFSCNGKEESLAESVRQVVWEVPIKIDGKETFAIGPLHDLHYIAPGLSYAIIRSERLRYGFNAELCRIEEAKDYSLTEMSEFECPAKHDICLPRVITRHETISDKRYTFKTVIDKWEINEDVYTTQDDSSKIRDR